MRQCIIRIYAMCDSMSLATLTFNLMSHANKYPCMGGNRVKNMLLLMSVGIYSKEKN